MGRGKWECDREAVEQIKVKLSAFTYLDERFQSPCLIISSPFFICTLFDPKASGREESFSPSLLAMTLSHSSSPLSLSLSLSHRLTLHLSRAAFVIRVITIQFLSIRTCSSYPLHPPPLLHMLPFTMFYAYEDTALLVSRNVCVFLTFCVKVQHSCPF